MTNGLKRVEKQIKRFLESYLNSHGWETEIAWGFTHGVDIEARREQDRWVIEVKGWECSEDSIANSFASVLGKLLQRMDDPDTKYSIALPDSDQFRRLWDRLPGLSKSRTGITAIFVDPEGGITERVPSP